MVAHVKQGVALTGRNHTGRRAVSTAHSPGRWCADHPRAWRPAALPIGSITDNRRQRAKQYWPIRRASDNLKSYNWMEGHTGLFVGF